MTFYIANFEACLFYYLARQVSTPPARAAFFYVPT